MDQQQDASSPSDGAFSKMAIFGIESVRSLDFIKNKKYGLKQQQHRAENTKPNTSSDRRQAPAVL
jgi:hypothetical protein